MIAGQCTITFCPKRVFDVYLKALNNGMRSKSGGISPSFALRVRIRFVALIIQASSF